MTLPRFRIWKSHRGWHVAEISDKMRYKVLQTWQEAADQARVWHEDNVVKGNMRKAKLPWWTWR